MASPRSGRRRTTLIRARIASLTSAVVESEPYWAIDSVTADALILSGSADPWAMHHPGALERFYYVLRGSQGRCSGSAPACRCSCVPRAAPSAPSAREDQGIRGGRGARRFRSLRRQRRGNRRLQESRGRGDHVAAGIPGPRDERTVAASRRWPPDDRPWWGTQFHPEAWDPEHPDGRAFLARFLQLAGVDG